MAEEGDNVIRDRFPGFHDVWSIGVTPVEVERWTEEEFTSVGTGWTTETAVPSIMGSLYLGSDLISFLSQLTTTMILTLGCVHVCACAHIKTAGYSKIRCTLYAVRCTLYVTFTVVSAGEE